MGILVIFLLIIITVLIVILYIKLTQIKYYKAVAGNMAAMTVMQRMFEIMASNIPAKKKIEELNSIIIDVFDSKYSTISIYDGTEYEVKATNVENTYIDSIVNIAEDNDFKSNAKNNISKYLVAAGPRVLGYKSAAERKIKSAMFSPIYYNGTYLGFWLMEDNAEDAYESISKDELAKLKDNIGVFIENVIGQENLENAYNTDKQTGFYNNIYLYSSVRHQTSLVDTSSLVLISFSGLPNINEENGRAVGDSLLLKATRLLKETIPEENIFVRYTGSRVVVVCPGVSVETIHGVIERYLSNLNYQRENVNGKEVKLDTQILMHTIKKQSNIEKEINKMNAYLEGMKEVNTIKII